jgi:hypothetical protein
VLCKFLVSDFRRERLWAVVIRQCANQGCSFEGSRASLSANEEQREYLPRAFLNQKNQVFQLKIEKLQALQLALLACALGVQLAASAL